MFLHLAGNERHFRCLSTKTKIACALVRGGESSFKKGGGASSLVEAEEGTNADSQTPESKRGEIAL